MDKFLERLVEVLPLPIFLAILAMAALAWLVRTLTGVASWPAVASRRSFHLGAALILSSTLLYYFIAFKDHLWPSPQFAASDLGIAIFQIEFDENNIVQAHLYHSMELGLEQTDRFDYISIRKVAFLPRDNDAATTLCRQLNAKFCIAGVFVKPQLLHVAIVSPTSSSLVGGLTIGDFTKTDTLLHNMSTIVAHIPPPADNPYARLAYVESQMAALQAENRQLHDLLSPRTPSTGQAIDPSPQPTHAGDYSWEDEKIRKRSLFAVGIDKYQSLSTLSSPVQDVRLLEGKLRGIWRNSATHTVLGAHGTKQGILDAMSRFETSLNDSDQAWIYLSGHALYDEERDEGYFMAYDSDPKNLFATAVPMSLIYEWFVSLPAKQAVMVVDTCYAGAVIKYASRGPVTPNWSAGEMASAAGRIILAATDRNGLSYIVNGEGIFTKAIVDGLSGSADVNGDGLIVGQELGVYTTHFLGSYDERGIEQRPVYQTLLKSGDLLLGLDPEVLERRRMERMMEFAPTEPVEAR